MNSFSQIEHRFPRFTSLPIYALAMCSIYVGCCPVQRFRGLSYQGDGTYIAGVPPVAQSDEVGCGPACLLAVTAYWRTVSDMSSTECQPRAEILEGAHSAADLRLMADSWGFGLLAFEGEPEDLTKNLGRGRPLIVMIPTLPRPYDGFHSPVCWLTTVIDQRIPRAGNHWVVVCGFDADGRIIILDPGKGFLTISRPYFDKLWSRRGRLCLIVFPREEAALRHDRD